VLTTELVDGQRATETGQSGVMWSGLDDGLVDRLVLFHQQPEQ